MDASTIDFLRQVNNRFYERCAPSFSATRNAPWTGWRRCLEEARAIGSLVSESAGGEVGAASSLNVCGSTYAVESGTDNGLANYTASVRVLDVACGNMRFASFLREELGGCGIDYFAVDDCDGLVPELASDDRFVGHFQNVDLIGELAQGHARADSHAGVNGATTLDEFGARFALSEHSADAEGLASRIDAPSCNFVGCFGFMHHVPSFDLRVSLLRALLEKTAPGGVACVSFWQFMGDAKFAKKVEAWHAAALEDFAARGEGRACNFPDDVLAAPGGSARDSFDGVPTVGGENACGALSEEPCAEGGALLLHAFDSSQLEVGDYFLGWQNEPGLWRYCHHFSEAEIDALVAAACEDGKAEEIVRFSADGKSGAMNRYVVLRKTADFSA